jgi:hypothetical protein
MGVRPSELFKIENEVAAYYLDHGLYRWATFVNSKMDEAEMAIRQSQIGKSSNASAFINSARTVAFNRLMGLSVASAYRQPEISGLSKMKPEAPIMVSGEEGFDMQKFNA